MARNPDAPPPTRAQTISIFAGHHAEAVCLVVGLLLGSAATLLGVLVRGL